MWPSAQAVEFPSAGLNDEQTIRHPPPRLVGQWTTPTAQGPWPIAILCHPQPLVADMDDPLTRRLAQDLTTAGWATLRFNFRGVAPSQGVPSDGRFEPLDVAGAVAFVLAQAGVAIERLALVGHAFGAIPALIYGGADPRVGAVVAVSPPHFRLTQALVPAPPHQARFFIIGSEDEVSPRHKVEPWVTALPGFHHLAVVRNAPHLMVGHEAATSALIVSLLGRWAAAGSGLAPGHVAAATPAVE